MMKLCRGSLVALLLAFFAGCSGGDAEKGTSEQGQTGPARCPDTTGEDMNCTRTRALE